jgi:hypothetical protein
MSLYRKSDREVVELAQKVLRTHESHKPLLEVGVRIDFLTARSEVDEHNMPIGPALTHHGHPALGIARINPDRLRALGHGDACVDVDGDWWIDATDEQRASLLDHELHHIALRTDGVGNPRFDYLKRPVLRMRKHDADFGWFHTIAQRNGVHSVERTQAKSLLDHAGQIYWPDIVRVKAEKVSERKIA